MRLGGLDKQLQDQLLTKQTIRIPVHMIETINKMVRTQRQIMSEFGREPTPEELAKKLAMPLKK